MDSVEDIAKDVEDDGSGLIQENYSTESFVIQFSRNIQNIKKEALIGQRTETQSDTSSQQMTIEQQIQYDNISSYQSSNSNTNTDRQDAKAIYQAIQSSNLKKLQNTLERIEFRRSLEIVNLFDQQGYTVLHAAAYCNTYEIASFLIKFFKQRLAQYLKQKLLEKYNLTTTHQLDYETGNQLIKKVRNAIKEWVNIPSRGEEGFYPLHFAAFHGNLKLIKLFVKCGANLTAKNKQGISVMHVSAQGDQAISLTYFKNRGCSVNERDGEGSTPLHWASFEGSDTAIYYLLAWNIEINARDLNGNTPLHLAVRSAEKFQNTRSIKELLIKGADIDLKEKQQKSSSDLADTINNINLREEIKSILSKKSSNFLLSRFKQPLKRIDRSWKHVSIYLFGMISTFISLFINVFPYIPVKEWIIAIIAFYIINMTFFFLTMFRSPGYVQKPDNMNFEKLLEHYDPNYLCPSCEVLCFADSRHCYICNKCVNKFDHHCQWSRHLYYTYDSDELYIIEKYGFIPIFIRHNPTTGQAFFYVTIMAILCICCIFVIPLTFMVYVQTQNVMMNQTTYKRFAKHKRNYSHDNLSLNAQQRSIRSNGPTLGNDISNSSRIPSWFSLCKSNKTAQDMSQYDKAIQQNPTPSSKSSQLTKIIFDHDEEQDKQLYLDQDKLVQIQIPQQHQNQRNSIIQYHQSKKLA
ncbi:dhhc zinc finger domain containing protein [Stylonychia lemnae]|uniref:Palmitoyltransferase n=1 Tax=Stylonychia lemnae TaxID=5949 RepID=A0A078B196_STYLE|nr:dhhc zinc finger domain containing protein [Stylonychia lemnae]|eukprot:CDW88101.1 dhhc zinc finger domain containing protein [Stylonychia lemnae]